MKATGWRVRWLSALCPSVRREAGATARSAATKFLMVVNRKTAKALGLAVPPSILLRATEVVE
jgi:hypothetical protein